MNTGGNPFDIAGQADDWGALLAVLGARELPPDVRGGDPRYDEFVFRFERGGITVTSTPDDDTVRLTSQGPTLPHQTDLSATEPWDRPRGAL
jgi:hypothetical protein